MTTKVRELYIADGKRIIVEVDISDDVVLSDMTNIIEDLPPGAEPTTSFSDLYIGMKLFQENIRNMVESVHASLKAANPDEWSVEMNIGFKGKATPIPYIASGELDGGIKITATWKKDK
jgi:hypothetical protein